VLHLPLDRTQRGAVIDILEALTAIPVGTLHDRVDAVQGFGPRRVLFDGVPREQRGWVTRDPMEMREILHTRDRYPFAPGEDLEWWDPTGPRDPQSPAELLSVAMQGSHRLTRIRNVLSETLGVGNLFWRPLASDAFAASLSGTIDAINRSGWEASKAHPVRSMSVRVFAANQAPRLAAMHLGPTDHWRTPNVLPSGMERVWRALNSLAGAPIVVSEVDPSAPRAGYLLLLDRGLM